MRNLFERLVKPLLKPLGYEMRRRAPALLGNAFEAQQRIVEALAPSQPVILDVGANIGGTAKRYRARLPQAEVYCFEPFPGTLARLRERYAGDSRVHVVPMAVADRPGRRTFYVNTYDATNSLLPRPASGKRYYPEHAQPKGTIEVEATSLDAFASENRIGSIAILKLDVQGSELAALRGAAGLLEHGAVSIVYSEAMFVPHYEGGPLFHEIWAYLERFGYSLYNLYDTHCAPNGQLRYGDALFVSPAVRSGVVDRLPGTQ